MELETIKTPCQIKVVYLKKNEQEIPYGDLTELTMGLPKMEKIKVNGKTKYVKKHYTQEEYETWQHKTTNEIVEGLNDLLPSICLRQKTMYYFTKEQQVMVVL